MLVALPARLSGLDMEEIDLGSCLIRRTGTDIGIGAQRLDHLLKSLKDKNKKVSISFALNRCKQHHYRQVFVRLQRSSHWPLMLIFVTTLLFISSNGFAGCYVDGKDQKRRFTSIYDA